MHPLQCDGPLARYWVDLHVVLLLDLCVGQAGPGNTHQCLRTGEKETNPLRWCCICSDIFRNPFVHATGSSFPSVPQHDVCVRPSSVLR